MVAVYGGFAVAAGLITFLILWAYMSPSGFFSFLVGVVAAAGGSVLAAWLGRRHFWKFASHAIEHPEATSRALLGM
jgi:membrane protein implicated in regulation of membrane protease activity